MAGRKRQSRARDSTYTHQRQRSTSQAGSIVPETVIAARSKVVEIAESADEASPRPERSPQPETPINRSSTAFCKNCNGKVGEFYNSWHKVTSSYYSPALLGSYRSLLRTSERSKQASDSTELAGCTIDLTCCPHCSNYLGFVVVETPASGKRFHGQEFFKLQHIELRCETSSGKTVTVEPQENVASDLDNPSPSPNSSPVPHRSGTATMELNSPLSSSHPLWGQSAPKEAEHQRTMSLSDNSVQWPLPSDASYPPPTAATTPHSPASQNITSTVSASTTAKLSNSSQPAQLQSANMTGSSAPAAPSTSTVNGLKNGHNYPRDPRDVQFDAIERLQTQTSQNTSALAAQARTQMESADIVRQIESSLRHEFQGQLQRQDQELRRMSDVVNQLSRDLQECHRNMMALAQEVRVTRAESGRRPSEAAQPGYQDEALELMARRIGDMSHRTTDLETMREHVAILSGKVQRLESESTGPRPQHPPPQQAHPAHQPIHQAVHPAHIPQPAPNQALQFQTPARPTSIPHAVQHHEQAAAAVPPESAQRQEPPPTQNGWATVNAGVKRVFENGTESPHSGASPTPGEPKRPKLSIEGSHDGTVISQHPPEPSQILPSQAQPVVVSQTLPQAGLHLGPAIGPHQIPHQGPHPAPPPSQAYVYSTQGEQNWHADPQHMVDGRPARGRGSRGGRGPGSRGGRVRKSMQGQHHIVGTPEWERGWSAVPDSYGSPTGFEDHPAHPARSIVRRGGGGGGARGGAMTVERSGEWTPEIGPRSVFHDRDSPIEVKKTRSKPIRNEDGILVRKDGRPDRRSQSSAANLRKVHARKEEQQREAEAGSTPTGVHVPRSTGPDTPSPSARGHSEPDVSDSVRKKHNAILGRIFPDGLDDSRKQHDYAHQVFHDDRDHTAQPRGHVSRTAKVPSQIKKEQVERSEVAETQAPAGGDVEMGDAEASTGRANGDSQSSSATANEQQLGAKQTIVGNGTAGREGRVQVPETQNTDNTANLAAESTVTA